MRLFFLLVISLLISTEYSAQNSIQNGMNNNVQDLNSEYVIIDSDYSFEEAVEGISIPLSIVNNLVLINVFYYSFDGQLHKGQLIVNKEVQEDITEIFEFIKETRFPIEKVIPIIKYDWSDEASTSDNNTTAFNYRFVSGTRIVSNHAYGYAIDINPMQNPYIKRNKVLPPGASYDTSVPGTITSDSQLVNEFKERGWSWGGDWRSVKDYQHFEKRIGK
ncbi:MAG: M15 family metallopeptidase [Ignavibacteriaceae bacterium]